MKLKPLITLGVIILATTSFASFANLFRANKKKSRVDSGAAVSAIQKEAQSPVSKLGVLFYHPSYILPYYYTSKPDYAVYQDNTPGNQKLQKQEFKMQLSIQVPVWHFILNSPVSLYASYTQLSYWQFYAASQYFRETDYEPQLFLTTNAGKDWLFRLGVDHESNGRGSEYERSWNRAFMDADYADGNWLFSVEPWVLIFPAVSSNLHNPDIAKYMGYSRELVVYKSPLQLQASLMVRNISHLKHTTFIGTLSFPLSPRVMLFIQVFDGYGQSMIDTN